MFTKAKLYNLTLGALLLQRQIVTPETDTSNECKVLNNHYDVAFRSTLEDLDLDSTSTQVTLSLLATDDEDFPEWKYIYAYPDDCAFFRRIKSTSKLDNRATFIEKKVGMYGTVKAIFTDEVDAIAEYISEDVELDTLSATVGLCISYKLASLASPLIVGKGAQKLREDIYKQYLIYKAEAQEQDRRENFNFPDPEIESEFIGSRIE